MLQKNKEKQERKEKRRPVLRPCRFTKRQRTLERRVVIEMNDIKLRDANKILKKNGFELRRVSGDHRHYYNAKTSVLHLYFT